MTNTNLTIADLKILTNGKIFTAHYIKKSTGKIAKMTVRMSVKSHLKGGEKKYDSGAKNYATVFNMHKKAYRTLVMDNLLAITFKGRTMSREELIYITQDMKLSCGQVQEQEVYGEVA